MSETGHTPGGDSRTALKAHVVVAANLAALPQSRHCCTGCFTEWEAPPSVDALGCHAAPDGRSCPGPINCFPKGTNDA